MAWPIRPIQRRVRGAIDREVDSLPHVRLRDEGSFGVQRQVSGAGSRHEDLLEARGPLRGCPAVQLVQPMSSADGTLILKSEMPASTRRESMLVQVERVLERVEPRGRGPV